MVIIHTKRGIRYWKALMTALYLVSSVVYAYFAGFRASSRHEILPMNSMEIIFFVDFLLNFYISYPISPKDPTPVTDLPKIRQRYYQTKLWTDLIPLLPLQLTAFDTFKEDLFWSIKTMRILQAFEGINVTNWFNFIKEYYISDCLNKNQELFQDPSNDEIVKDRDYSRIGEFLLFHNVLKGLRIFLVITCTCYFFAMFFKIIVVGEEDFEGHITLSFCDNAGGYFVACFDGWQMTLLEEMIKINYFSFTTLSTVGFGDFEPRSNLERVYMAFGMLLGVAIFSSILGNFIDMLDNVKSFQKDFEDGSSLLCFFGLFKRLNKGVEMPHHLHK